MTAQNPWTDDRVSSLKKLWDEGLSASQIASRLGDCTRNAVIGKSHRLGLPGRIARRKPKPRPVAPPEAAICAPVAQGSTVAPVFVPVVAPPPMAPELSPARVKVHAPKTPQPAPVAPELPKPIVTVEEEPRAADLQLIDLSPSMCRWPLGEPGTAEFHFCGDPREDGRPYCRKHTQVAYVPMRKFRAPVAGWRAAS
jgi:GcrA cell cycle regulator